MKFLYKAKDGGPYSTVTGYWLVEIKKLISVVLLKFEDGSRDAFHTHAFNSVNWVLRGEVWEEDQDEPGAYTVYEPSWRPVVTRRTKFHKVTSQGTTWVLSLRGPWADRWKEWLPAENRFVTMTHGRKVVSGT